MSARGGVLAFALLGVASAASAQATLGGGVEPGGQVRWEWGGHLFMAEPVGEFADHVEGGGGFGVFGIRYLGGGTGFGVRLDLTLLSYGRSSESYALVLNGTGVDVDLTTDNAIATLAIGPHLVLGRGRVRPFVGASVGSAQFVTTNAAWAGGRAIPIASAEVLERYALALAAGGGVRLAFREQRAHPISLELDAHYRRHGSVEYLRKGGVRELPDGSVELDPIVSSVSLWTIHIAGVVGFR